MSQNTSEMSLWTRFFTEASIPHQFAHEYATKFCENRIRFDMLADLDRPLLNDLGITAIGDCLSILKHAKSNKHKIVETTKESVMDRITNSNTELPSKPKNEIAKRIIGSYISRSPNQSDSDSEKKSSDKNATSNLSAKLFSRLNFNPVSKHCVSSTTNDEDEEFSATKRKHGDSDDEEMDSSEKPALQYRGFLKNTPDTNERTVVQLSNNKRVLSTEKKVLDGKPNISITRRISVKQQSPKTIISTTTTTTKKQTVNEIKPSPTPLQKKKLQFGSLQSDLIQKSVFKRIDVATAKAKSTRQAIPNKTLVKNISMSDIKSRISPIEFNSPKQHKQINKSVTITVKNTDTNRKIVPITFKTEEKKPVKLSSVVKPVQNVSRKSIKRPDRSIFSRISL